MCVHIGVPFWIIYKGHLDTGVIPMVGLTCTVYIQLYTQRWMHMHVIILIYLPHMQHPFFL